MKTRKLLAIVLALAMMASIFVIPSAAVEAGAACEILGLLQGDGEGVTAEYLAKATIRAQGLLISLRTMGLEGTATVFTGTDTFSDAADVNAEFWGPILAYAKANPSCGWVGYGDGTFHPSAIMTGAELAKVMLAVLGYEQGVDFEWADIATFAAAKGITVVVGSVDNNDLAASLVEALAVENKDGVLLVDALITAEVITQAQAIEAEVKEAAPAAPYTVAVTGVKTVVVTFAAAQDTATAIITLKKGLVGQAITTTWNTAKTVATIAKTTSFTAGDYTLTANTVATTFNIAANETATELVMLATTVYRKTAAQDLKIHLLNQYGEQMAYSAANVVGGVSFGTLAFVNNSATLTLTTLPAAGTSITVFAYYAAKNFTVNSTVTVIDDQKLSSISFTGPVTQGTASKAYTRLTEGTTGNTLAFKAYDQYGNVLNLTSYTAGTDYTLVISNATATVGNGVLTLDTVTKGTFSVRAIVMTTGAVSEMFSETVYAVPALASFDVVAPDAIYAGTAAAFTVAGLDQYGIAFTVSGLQLDAMTINPLSTTVTIAASGEVNTDNKSTLTFAAAGTADLYFIGSTTVIKTITVLAAKTVAEVNTVTVPVALQTGNTFTITSAGVTLKDQYGNAIAIVPANYSLELRRLAETNPYGVVSTGTDATVVTLAGLAITAQKAGTEQLRLTYYTGTVYGSTATNYREFVYDFAVTVVNPASVVAYELTTSKDVMCTDLARNASHDLTITLVGKTANGTAVTLIAAAGQLPTIVAQYTVTGTGAQIVGNKLTVLATDTDGIVTIKAWNSAGVVVASKDVLLDKATPTITGPVTIAVNATTGVVTVSAVDQFGVAIAAPAGTFYTSDAAKIVLSGATGTTVQTTRASGSTALTAVVRYVSVTGAYSAEISVTQ